ncbi:L,D-transpeptidase family protein [Clostridium saccharoperbutylacetonicum]|uniref:L,D-transpeptidase n=1 Tax=Clostridium saccharoperbutylacetonicum TaxID=36745 RepID=UPI0039E7C64A
MNINLYSKTHSKTLIKRLIYFLVFVTILSFTYFYESYKYKKLINNFKTNFEEYEFSNANNDLLILENFNPFKLFLLKRDISNYFYERIETLSEDISNKKISSEEVLIQLNEIKHYNIIDDDKINSVSSSIDLVQDSINNYKAGISYYNNQQYINAISSLKKVSSLDLNYTNSLIYLKYSKSKLKETIFAYCDNLVNNDHYSDALSKISDNNKFLGIDSDVDAKISDIKSKQQEYFDKNSAIAEASSSALTSAISTANINTLNIESNTSYFVNVNLSNQKTYIYKGKTNNWNLIKTCPCSTGIKGEDTPSGSFAIKEKGDWFFSERYSQGGKYWSQITGDILFHSFPFAKDKSTILNTTLNKPSSHGCIRLSIDDAKWFYTNISKGSKVIIK